MKDTPRKLMKNRMWKKHLWWIIPITLIFGIIIGALFYASIQIHSDRLLFDVTMSCMEELYNVTLA